MIRNKYSVMSYLGFHRTISKTNCICLYLFIVVFLPDKIIHVDKMIMMVRKTKLTDLTRV